MVNDNEPMDGLDAQAGEELLKFPVAYPIKVLGRRHELNRAEVDAVVRTHAPDLRDDQISERESHHHHFVAITYTINAQNKEQIVALATALQAVKGVMMLI